VQGLRHFDGSRYELEAFAVMPNHVHVVFFLHDGSALPKVMHSWKSYTGKKLKRRFGLSENVWQAEYFDRVVRDGVDLSNTVRYVVENPIKAGLVNWPWIWRR
jgi:REP element-mobilizing transposase RayT